MIRSAFVVGVLGLAGCSQAQPDPGTPSPPVTVVTTTSTTEQPPKITTPGVTPQQPGEPITTQPAKPPEPPTVFDYPSDLGGKAVVKAVTPTFGKMLPAVTVPATPKPRTFPTRLLDPDPITKAEYVPPPILPAKPAEPKPTAPPERVPVDLGLLADDIPAKPTFPVVAGIVDRARDVKIPPALPILGRPFTERVSLDDPTAEFGNTGIVGPVVKVQVSQTGFLRVTLPDPFELGEQVRPRVLAAVDPWLTPVVVNPQRVK